MQSETQSSSPTVIPMPLEDFGQLQARYKSLNLAGRAAAVLKDAGPALQTVEEILKKLAANPQIKQTFSKIRKNPVVSGRMRPSEARNMLMDASCDFIEETRRKLAAWRKTMERVSQGEDIVTEQNKEYIPGTAPLALAIAGNTCISNYLSIVQITLTELTKSDGKNADSYKSTMAEIRRCATVLSDYEDASGIATVVVN